MHISVRELIPFVISCAIWGSEMPGCHIRCLCDNAAVVFMISKHTSKNPAAMHLLRWLFFVCAGFNIALPTEHVPGLRSKAADALSRNNLSTFFQKIPSACRVPSVIPPALIELLLDWRPSWLSAEWSSAIQACL